MTFKGLKIRAEKSLMGVFYSGSIKFQKFQSTVSWIKVLPEYLTASGKYRRLAFLSTHVDMMEDSQAKKYLDEERQIRERILKECVSITEKINQKAEKLIEKNEQILAEIERIKSEAQAKGF